jgi:predicted transcriptional regulator of viral defense system
MLFCQRLTRKRFRRIIFLIVNDNSNKKKWIMRYRDFESKIKHLPVFNLNDVRKLDPGFHRPQLSYWQERGYIKPLAGGYYALADRDIDEMFLFMVANKLYEPSYVSLESALAYYQVIPETVLGVTSVSSRKTKQFESAWGVFSYRTIKPGYMIGYRVVEISPDKKIKIACPEKAVLDYLYLNSEIQSVADFEGLRWNRDQLQTLLDRSVFSAYVNIFNKRALENRINQFMEHLDA